MNTRGRRWTSPATVVMITALAAVLPRVPLLRARLSPDEGGFLLIAGQWHPGSSLYGDYWVDRPPLLVAIFGVAHWLGGAVALRVIGCLAVLVAVLLAAALGRQVAGSRGAAWSSVAAAAYLSTPLFDSEQVSGELLAVPFVLAGVLAWLASRSRPAGDPHRLLLAAAAGASGAAAFLVKQNFIDVLVVAAAVGLTDLARGRSWRAVAAPSAALLSGGVVVTTGVLLFAATRGTSVAGVWDAVVTFRLQASQVIAGSASGATAARLIRFPGALLGSGAVAIAALLAAAVVRRRHTDPVAVAALALLAWEVVAAVSGGSYWMHYLLGLVPGLTLAVAVVAREAQALRRWLGLAVGWAVLATSLAVLATTVVPPSESASQATGAWLGAHRRTGDTALVAYGQPNILADSGTSSPYPELWSLPVRVRDPHLRQMARVLRGSRAPDWLLVWHRLPTWGVDARSARSAVIADYREVADVCGYEVYLHDGVRRTHGTGGLPASCTTGAAAGWS